MGEIETTSPPTLPLAKPGDWFLCTAEGPLCGMWLKLDGIVKAACCGTPRTYFLFEIGELHEQPVAITIPPELLKRLPPPGWRNLPGRLKTRLIAWGLRLATRTFCREAAERDRGPNRLDLLRQQLRDLRAQNSDLACALAKEQSRNVSLRPWVAAREAN